MIDREISNDSYPILQFLKFGFIKKQKLKQNSKIPEKSLKLLLQCQCLLLKLLIKTIILTHQYKEYFPYFWVTSTLL